MTTRRRHQAGRESNQAARPARHSLREVRAAQRPHAHRGRRPLRPAGARGRDLPRGLGPRADWQVGLCALLRAHDVPGLRPRGRPAALQAGDGRRRQPQRQHQPGPHQLLRDPAQQPARNRPVAGGRPHGLPARRREPEEVRDSALHREKRARPELRQPPLRPGQRVHLAKRSTPTATPTPGSPSATSKTWTARTWRT